MTEIKVKCPDCNKEITVLINTIDVLKEKIQQLEKQIAILQSGDTFEKLFCRGF